MSDCPAGLDQKMARPDGQLKKRLESKLLGERIVGGV
jgi:hypothetical protein